MDGCSSEPILDFRPGTDDRKGKSAFFTPGFRQQAPSRCRDRIGFDVCIPYLEDLLEDITRPQTVEGWRRRPAQSLPWTSSNSPETFFFWW